MSGGGAGEARNGKNQMTSARPALPCPSHPSSPMRILFAGIIARYPFGGVTWCSLMYLLGLRALGHEVFYIEDTGECVYDPSRTPAPPIRATGLPIFTRARAIRTRRSVVVRELRRQLSRPDRATTSAATRRTPTCSSTSGGSWFWRDEYIRIPRKVFVDSDPAFTQLAIAKAEPWYVSFFERFDHLFTFGSNIGTERSPVPTGAFTWHKTWQPITLDDWRTALPPGDRFTSVMTWQIESFTDVGGNKDQEFVRYIDLPSRTPQRFELAINGPQKLLREHGWDTVDAMQRVANAGRVSRFHPALEGRVRRGEAHVRGHTIRMVQRSHGVLSRRGPPRARAGHGLDRASAVRAAACWRFRRIDEAVAGIDRINTRLRPARRVRGRDRAGALRRRARCCRGCSNACMSIEHLASAVTAVGSRQSASAADCEDRARRAGRDDDSAAAIGIGGDDDVAADRRARRARTRRHALRHGRLHHPGQAPRDLPARLFPRSAHVALGAARAAEPRRGRGARGRFRPGSLRGRVLPDVAGVLEALAGAAPADAALLAWPGRDSALVEVSGGAVRGDLERAAAADARPQCRRHGPARGGYRRAHVPANSPTITCCFSDGSPKARASLQAIEIAKRVKHAADPGGRGERLLSRHGGALRRRHARSSMPGRRTSRPR